jgi:hypothetical protein
MSQNESKKQSLQNDTYSHRLKANYAEALHDHSKKSVFFKRNSGTASSAAKEKQP